MNRSSILTLAGLVLGAAVAVSCNKGPEKIVIGVSAELTGSIPVAGQSCKNAAEFAVATVNAAGGLEVAGKKYPVEILVEDNEDKAESAAAAAQKLVSAGVLAMVGPNASRNAIPASEVAEAAKVPMISPWSTAAKLTLDARSNQPKKYVFRACFIDDFQGVVAAGFAESHLKSKKPAVLYDVASEYNKGIAEVYGKSLKKRGIELAAFESYTTGDKDFSALLTKIQQSGADSLFLPNYYSEVPLQVKQARKLGFTGPILGSDSWGSPELLTLCGGDCEGQFFTTHYAPDIATPKAKEFIQKYQAAKGKVPDDLAALTWDSFSLLFQAIQNAGKLDRQAVRDALAKISSFEGVTGTMEFKGTGDPVKSAVVIQIKDGKYTYFQTAKP